MLLECQELFRNKNSIENSDSPLVQRIMGRVSQPLDILPYLFLHANIHTGQDLINISVNIWLDLLEIKGLAWCGSDTLCILFPLQ